MLTPREKSPLPKMSPEEDRTRDTVDSEPKHYQLSYSGPPTSQINQQGQEYNEGGSLISLHYTAVTIKQAALTIHRILAVLLTRGGGRRCHLNTTTKKYCLETHTTMQTHSYFFSLSHLLNSYTNDLLKEKIFSLMWIGISHNNNKDFFFISELKSETTEKKTLMKLTDTNLDIINAEKNHVFYL